MRTQASQLPPGLAQQVLSPGQGGLGHSQVIARNPTVFLQSVGNGLPQPCAAQGWEESLRLHSTTAATGRSTNLLDLAAVQDLPCMCAGSGPGSAAAPGGLPGLPGLAGMPGTRPDAGAGQGAAPGLAEPGPEDDGEAMDDEHDAMVQLLQDYLQKHTR